MIKNLHILLVCYLDSLQAPLNGYIYMGCHIQRSCADVHLY